MNDVVGMGHVSIELDIAGLEDSDWAALEAVDGRVRRPDSQLLEINNVEVVDKKARFSLVVDIEGTWRAGLRLRFKDGAWVTTYKAYEFTATDSI